MLMFSETTLNFIKLDIAEQEEIEFLFIVSYCTLLKKAQSMRFEACLPDFWCKFAIAAAAHVYNCIPVRYLK